MFAKDGWQSGQSSSECSEHFLNKDLYVNERGECNVRHDAVPAKLQVCRICFSNSRDLYSMALSKKLRQAYEDVTGLSMEEEDNLPPFLCFECAQRLLNSVQIRNKSLRARLILLEATKNRDCITLEYINSIIAKENSLCSNLSVIHKPMNHYDLEIQHVEKKNVAENEAVVKEIALPDFKKLHKDSAKSKIDDIEEVHETDDTNHVGDVNNDYMESFQKLTVCDDAKINEDMNADIIGDNTDFNLPNLHQRARDVGIEIDEGIEQVKEKNYMNQQVSRNNKVNDNMAKMPHSVTDTIVSEDDNIINLDNLNLEDIDHGIVNVPVLNNNSKTDITEANVIMINKNDLPVEENQTQNVNQEMAIDNNGLSENIVNPEAGSNIINVETSGDVHPCPSTSTLGVRDLNVHGERKKFRCYFCCYTTSQERKLELHHSTHSDDTPSHANKRSGKRNSCSKKYSKRHSNEESCSFGACKKKHKEIRELSKYSKNFSDILERTNCITCSKNISENDKLLECFKRFFGQKSNVKNDFEDLIMKCNDRTHRKKHICIKNNCCKFCKKVFKGKKQLKFHLRMEHLNNKNIYPCSVCRLSFFSKRKLKRHLKTHSGAPHSYNSNKNKPAFTQATAESDVRNDSI